ncbi:phospholipase A2 [Xylariaceae sp. FL1651]|nr:phospholipase A2 [Xylariaceae sp. FL1651]
MAQPAAGGSPDKWGSFLSRLNPVPRFPEYTGPYKVGTVDVEIPIYELDSPAPTPENAADIETVQFRIFYPCEPNAKGKRITWLPAPQRDHLSAYIQFLGVGPYLAEAASFLPRHLHYTSIPVTKNAPILHPQTPNSRWPTMIFSHGLGGSRNAYSQIAGSLASHGMVVICPEHRDGSAVASFIRIPSEQDRFFMRNTRRMVPYNRIPHDVTDEVHELRNAQLRIRLWELGLIHEAILGIDEGQKLTNLNKSTPSLDQFAAKMHVHEPGSIIFAGHSFGAATTVQFLKSVFYAGRPELEAMDTPLYTPNWESSICRQVTPQNVTILLDLWCFPLLAKTTKPLFNLPLPVYAPSDPSSSPSQSPGGTALLAVESEDFYKWREHLHATARVLSPDPAAQVVAAAPPSATTTTRTPHFFYVRRSAHLSQSDFALLFPWLTRKVFGSEAPERALRLNLRAVLQVLRVNGVPVAGTRAEDLVDGVDAEVSGGGGVCTDDVAILERARNAIREDDAEQQEEKETTDEFVHAWRWIDIVGMGEVLESEGKTTKKKVAHGDEVLEGAEEEEPRMAGVIEPGASAPPTDPRVDVAGARVVAASA